MDPIRERSDVCARVWAYAIGENFEKSHASGTKLSIANKKKFSQGCAHFYFTPQKMVM